jgi:hypothetical protein
MLFLSPDGRFAATYRKFINFEVQELKLGVVYSMQVPSSLHQCIGNSKTSAMRATPSHAQHMHTENQYICFAHEGFAVSGTVNENKVYVWDAKCRDQLLTLDHGGKFVKFGTDDSTDRWHRGFESMYSSGVSSAVVLKVLVALLTQNIDHVCR